tara:strand:- start:1607 stop:2176 length:570 start_codon:yes stop_codon:yes gene_type:complete
MATTNPFLSIRNSAGDTVKSVDWYQEQVKSLRGLTPNKLMQNSPELVNQVLPGRMYFFVYDAKLKDTLPYWDTFPLVLPFKKVPDGFLGINLHYLPYIVRFKLLGALHTLAVDSNMSENNRLRLSWQLLESSSKFNPVRACVKHYLDSQVRSRYLSIKYPDWVTASQLPVERFVGANKTEVWKDSRKKY